jgi:hypothetical protein
MGAALEKTGNGEGMPPEKDPFEGSKIQLLLQTRNNEEVQLCIALKNGKLPSTAQRVILERLAALNHAVHETVEELVDTGQALEPKENK